MCYQHRRQRGLLLYQLLLILAATMLAAAILFPAIVGDAAHTDLSGY